MKPRIHSMNENLAKALRAVVGGELKQSNLGEVWRDDRTWRRIADELIMALAGKVALIDREVYARIFADAEQMKLVRSYVEDYKSRLPKDQQKRSERNKNPIARWAAENMGPKEEAK
jgi:hypothetical protein